MAQGNSFLQNAARRLVKSLAAFADSTSSHGPYQWRKTTPGGEYQTFLNWKSAYGRSHKSVYKAPALKTGEWPATSTFPPPPRESEKVNNVLRSLADAPFWITEAKDSTDLLSDWIAALLGDTQTAGDVLTIVLNQPPADWFNDLRNCLNNIELNVLDIMGTGAIDWAALGNKVAPRPRPQHGYSNGTKKLYKLPLKTVFHDRLWTDTASVSPSVTHLFVPSAANSPCGSIMTKDEYKLFKGQNGFIAGTVPMGQPNLSLASWVKHGGAGADFTDLAAAGKCQS
jgi:hypothetical protein